MFRLPWRRAANVAELVYALDLGSSGETLGSSSLPIRTISQLDRNLSACLLGFLESP